MNFASVYIIVTLIVGGFWSAVSYKDLLVEIGKDVEEDSKIIDNIKWMIGNATSVLNIATQGRISFHQAMILIPSTWRVDTNKYSEISRPKSQAQVRIDKPHPLHGDSPYTLQQGGCGDPGTYIHFSSNYALNMYGELEKSFGDPGKVFAHEWAHFRWGVFDEYAGEYGSPFPPFYIDEDWQVHATGCTKEMKGWMRTSDGEKCHADEMGLPDEDCHFIPDEYNYANASLMNLYYLESVTAFCNKKSHNPNAPTPHNFHCKGRSVWDVISQHEDFQGSKKSSTYGLRFQVHRVTPEKAKFILFVAVSASAEEFYNEIYQGIVSFVRVLVPTGSKMAMVFSNGNSWHSKDFRVVDDTNRDNIVNDLPRHIISNEMANQEPYPYGLKDIGSAEVILVADDESSLPYDLKGMKDVTFNTISLSPNVADSLRTLANETDGKSLYYKRGSRILDSLLMKAITSGTEDLSEELFQVDRVLLKMKSSSVITNEVILDRSLGHETRFTFSETSFSTKSFSTKVELISPDNTVYNKDSTASIYQQYSNTRTIIFSIADAKPGRWSYTVSNVSPESNQAIDVLVVATSYPRKDAEVEPIRAKSWMSKSDVKYPSPCIVNAFVTQGYTPIINANVTAVIEGPGKEQGPIYLSLHDNGIGSDVVAGDGQYSAYFTSFSDNGYYTVSAVVTTKDSTAKLLGLASRTPSANAVRRFQVPDRKRLRQERPASTFHPASLKVPIQGGKGHPGTPHKEDKMEPFKRFVSGGSFKVEEYDHTDKMPPGPVKDLTVTEVSLDEATVTLSFTSSGGNYDQGQAHEMELRYNGTMKFIEEFDMSQKISEMYVKEGDLKPRFAGEKHTVKIKLPDKDAKTLEGRAYFFALKLKDEKDNSGEISNIAVAYFPLEKFARMKSVDIIRQVTGLVVLVVVGAFAIIISVFITTIKLLHKRRRMGCVTRLPWTYDNPSLRM